MLLTSKWNSHQEDQSPPFSDTVLQLHAQRETLQLIIGVVVCVFVETQRRDAYYRNDPSKYGLAEKASSMQVDHIYSTLLVV